MSWLQWVAGAVIVIGLGVMGWRVVHAFQRAGDADRLEVELADVSAKWKKQIDATAKADNDRLAVSNDLAATKAALDEDSKGAVRYVVKKVSDARVCDLGVESIGVLNTFRGYPAAVSTAPARAAAPRAAP